MASEDNLRIGIRVSVKCAFGLAGIRRQRRDARHRSSDIFRDGEWATGKLISASYVERVLLTGIVSRLVRKGVIEQIPDDVEQCQKRLRIAATGSKRREQLPDPIALLQSAAFDGVDESELALVVEVFQAATDRFNNHHLFLEPKK